MSSAKPLLNQGGYNPTVSGSEYIPSSLATKPNLGAGIGSKPSFALSGPKISAPAGGGGGFLARQAAKKQQAM